MQFRSLIRRNVLIVSASLLLLTGFRTYDDLFEFSKNLEIFNAAYREVGKNFVDEIKPGDLMKKGMDAMLSSLDPYTVFYSESQTEEALLDRQGEYSGVGCRVFLRNHYPVVSEVFANYAFAKADVRPGDILKTISGQSMKDRTMGDVSVFLRGAPETDFEIEIEREGTLIKKTITRVQVTTKNVPYYGAVDDQTGYIKLEQFGPKCASEIADALKELNRDRRLKYVILDLRDNGGGLLNEAVNIVGLFTRAGELVVKMKGRTPQSTRDWTTSGPGPYQDIPLAVMINSRSASASEVVSGSLQDLDRAVVVGRNSFGKGLVQNYFQLPYRTQMKITTAKYYTPSGRCIQLLDYRHRNDDGSAGKMPDSLRTAFKTHNGRIVYDGGGVKPDLEIDEFQGQPLLKMIIDERYLFDFANHYRNTHETIAPAREFSISDAEMNQFIKSTATKLTEKISGLATESMKKAIPDDELVESVIARKTLTEELNSSINKKLEIMRKSLQYRLTQEILKRYYFDAALYESSFTGDPDLQATMELLKNEARYRKTLLP